MPFHPIANCAKVEILMHHTITLQPVVNVLHCAATSAPTQAEVQAYADAVDHAVGSTLNVWGSQVHYDGTRVTDQNTATGPQALTTTSAGQGTGGNNTAAGVCCLVKLATTLRSRSGRGRIFIGPCPQSDLINDGTQWDPSYLGVIGTFMGNLAADLAAATPASELVVGSKKLGTAHPVITPTPQSAPAYQRRRAGR